MCVDGEVCRRYDGCECLHQEVCGVTTQIITTTDKHVANNTISIAGSVSGIVLVIILAGIVVLILVIRKRNSNMVPFGTDFIPDDSTVYSMICKYLEVSGIHAYPNHSVCHTIVTICDKTMVTHSFASQDRKLLHFIFDLTQIIGGLPIIFNSY